MTTLSSSPETAAAPSGRRTRGRYVRWTEAEHRLAVQLRAEGLTLRAIAARLGVTVRRVRARLRNSDEKPTSQSAPRKCLCCLKTFASAGPFNRLCRACKDAA